MNETFIAIIILSCGMFLSFCAGYTAGSIFEMKRNQKLLIRHKVGGPGFDDIYYQGKKIETKDTDSTSAIFISEPTKQSLENLKDPELLDFYETIEKPSEN